MKLLLTSAGLTNPEICQALAELTGKPLTDCKILIVVTASMADQDYGKWLIKDLRRVKDQNFQHIDIIDFAALPRELWQPRFENAEILFFTGGNPYHLLSCTKKSGLDKLLPTLLETRIYVGKSAGSTIVGPTLGYSTPKAYAPEDIGNQPISALSLTEFSVRSHFGDPQYASASKAEVEKTYEKLEIPVYAIDDYSAVKVDDDKVIIVGDKNFLKLPD